ncbi:hypothetical protein RFI_20477, partial [Reticulomyxa filosa]
DDQHKWYEACIRYVGKEGTPNAGKVAIHFIGWADKWDEWITIGNYERLALRHSHTLGKPHRPRKNNRMARALIPPPPRPGKVAQAWAQLLKDMFSNRFRVVAPRDFKAAIGEKKKGARGGGKKENVHLNFFFFFFCVHRFMGYSQQDSQELLSFLLDGLHEDLNQIQDKPGTTAVESSGRPDEVVAAEAWQTYLKRNVSIIVDLLQGQYKSRVECPDCGKVSITFDPYMFLSVPLPTERYKVMEFTWVSSAPGASLPTVYGVK